MSRDEIQSRVDRNTCTVDWLGVAYVDGYTPRYEGLKGIDDKKLNIVRKKGQRCWGVLVRINKECNLSEVYRKEGLYRTIPLYRCIKLPRVVLTTNAKIYKALAFVMTKRGKNRSMRKNTDPSYVNKVLAGATRSGLPRSYIEKHLDV